MDQSNQPDNLPPKRAVRQKRAVRVNKRALLVALIAFALLLLVAGAMYYANHRTQPERNPAVVEYEKRIPDLKKAVDKDPKNAGARYDLASAYYAVAVQDRKNINRGRLSDAISQYQSAVKNDGKNASYYNALGNALRDNEKYNEAVDAYSKSIEINKAGVNAYANLISVQETNKDDKKAALETATKAVDNVAEKDKLGMQYTKARLLKATGKNDEAKALYRTILDKNKDDPVAKFELENFDK